jgi:hypothetical protein
MAEQLDANRVEIAAGAEVHDRIGANRQGRFHLLDLGLDRAADAAGANIGIDFRPELPPDARGPEIVPEMNSVGRNHQPAGRHLLTNHYRLQILTRGDVPHGVGDGAGLGFGQLCRHDSLLLAANKKNRFCGEAIHRIGISLSIAFLRRHIRWFGVYPDQVPRVFSQTRHPAGHP